VLIEVPSEAWIATLTHGDPRSIENSKTVKAPGGMGMPPSNPGVDSRWMAPFLWRHRFFDRFNSILDEAVRTVVARG